MTRAEHLQWAKDRALRYVDIGDCAQALASMGSDLSKHPELENHAGLRLMAMFILSGHLTESAEVRKHIEGYR